MSAADAVARRETARTTPSSRARGERLSGTVLLLLFAVAFGARALYLVEMRDSPLQAVLLGDGEIYDQWARRIVFGSGWGSTTYYQTPLYSWFLAGVYSIAPTLEAARWTQATLGSLACVALAVASSRLFGARAGALAGLLLALHAPAIAYDGAIEKTTLDTLAICAVLFLLSHDAPRVPWRCFAAGMALALGALNRESLWCALIIVVPWTLWRTSASRAKSSACFAAGIAVVLAAASWQQWAVHGELTPSRGQFGANLYIGNHAGADGLYSPLRPGAGTAKDEEIVETQIAEAALGRELTRREVSDYWAREAWSWIASEPGDALALFARKLRYTLYDREWADTHGYAAWRRESRVLALLGTLFRFGILFALAVFALVAVDVPRRSWPWLALAALLVLATAVFFVFGRYRLVLVPLLAPFAAAGLLELLRRSAWTKRKLAAAVAASIAALSAFGPTAAADTSLVDSWCNLATALCDSGRPADAEAYLRRALAEDPAAPGARVRLARALAARGRPAEARNELERALQLDPSLTGTGWFQLAIGHAEHGDLEPALAAFARAVEADPASSPSWHGYALALRQAQRLAEAETAYRRALALRPRDADTLNDLGYLLELTGRAAEALACYDQALATDPDHPRARANRDRLAPTRE